MTQKELLRKDRKGKPSNRKESPVEEFVAK